MHRFEPGTVWPTFAPAGCRPGRAGFRRGTTRARGRRAGRASSGWPAGILPLQAGLADGCMMDKDDWPVSNESDVWSAQPSSTRAPS